MNLLQCDYVICICINFFIINIRNNFCACMNPFRLEVQTSTPYTLRNLWCCRAHTSNLVRNHDQPSSLSPDCSKYLAPLGELEGECHFRNMKLFTIFIDGLPFNYKPDTTLLNIADLTRSVLYSLVLMWLGWLRNNVGSGL